MAGEDLDAVVLGPWSDDGFQAGLLLLTEAPVEAARRHAALFSVLAEMAAMVPRESGDERGSSPWTSFRREVAVALRVSDRAAAGLVRQAVLVCTSLPVTWGLLREGRLSVGQCSALVGELEQVDLGLAARVDAEQAQACTRLAPWRVAERVRRALLVLDPDVAAVRAAQSRACRGVRVRPQPDGQAEISVFGPAVPALRFYDTLDARARALKQAGDVRTLSALRFDVAVAQFPCEEHSPPEPPAWMPTGEELDAGWAVAQASAAADQLPDEVFLPAQPTGPTATTGPRWPGAAGGCGMPCVGLAGACWSCVRAEQDRQAVFALGRSAGVEAASVDCRRARPVQVQILVPVETALGLSNAPGYLPGYGWLDAPTSRVLMADAELRQVCVDSTGRVIDMAERAVRPPPDPLGVREHLLELVATPFPVTNLVSRGQAQHDPSDNLRAFVHLRDGWDDGPTGGRVPARACQLDHDTAWPAGPTAAWNLVARGTRTHQLKHHGWTPLRTPTVTWWTSPAGQIVQVEHHTYPPPGIDEHHPGCEHEAAEHQAAKHQAGEHQAGERVAGHARPRPVLPDPSELADLDADLIRWDSADIPPQAPPDPDAGTTWTWLHDEPPPF